MSPEEEKLCKIFLPDRLFREDAMMNSNKRFVHYTSAEAAINILKTSTFWLRESSCMNDSSEVNHGLRAISEAWDGEQGKFLRDALNKIFPEICDKIKNYYNKRHPYIKSDTYLGCFSEHEENENAIGRLSMWRAYSEGSGVALVMKNGIFFKDSDSIKGLYTSAVSYSDMDGIGLELIKIANNINENSSFVKTLPEEKIIEILFSVLRFTAICTKHPGFAEEKEWRLIYCPSIEFSSEVREEISVIRGVPQIVQKVPLDHKEISEYLDKIIIGPTEFPVAMHKAFQEALIKMGIDNPEERICVSEIPLRFKK